MEGVFIERGSKAPTGIITRLPPGNLPKLFSRPRRSDMSRECIYCDSRHRPMRVKSASRGRKTPQRCQTPVIIFASQARIWEEGEFITTYIKGRRGSNVSEGVITHRNPPGKLPKLFSRQRFGYVFIATYSKGRRGCQKCRQGSS